MRRHRSPHAGLALFAGPAPFAVLVLLAAGACDASTGPDVRRLNIEPEVALVVGVGESIDFEVTAVGEGEAEVSTEGVVWATDDSGVARIDGGRATGVRSGLTIVTARLGGRVATATLEVFEPEVPGSFTPGVSYFGRHGYVEYIPGTLPVVISAGHGGDASPDEIPDRTYGVVVRDTNTRELTYAIRDALLELTGHAPHVVVSHLRRAKLDPNREIEEAAQGSPFAERAWTEYHEYIRTARAEVGSGGAGLYLDVHGHGHPTARVELGYLVSPERLDGPDTALDSASVVDRTSIREIGRRSSLRFSALLRGPSSFGGLLEGEGVRSIPSPSDPRPSGDPYFSGNYSTFIHGSIADGEVVSAIQLEHHYPGLRDSDENRRAYAERLARVIRTYAILHFGYFEPPGS